MPKLRLMFSLVSRPFWCPMTMTETPPSRAQPPTIGRVVPVEPVAVQLDEVGEDGAEVVEACTAGGGGGPP